MLFLEIPPGTTIETLVTEAIPALHARWVAEDAPADPLAVTVCIEGRGTWTWRIEGRRMHAQAGAVPRPTLWVHTTESSAQRFLEDALGPRRLLPREVPGGASSTAARTLSDPRVIRRVALAQGRIELAVTDEQGARLAVVFGFGDAARRRIDPDDPDTVVEVPLATIDAVMQGKLSPDEALARGEVTLRGSRLLAMQLALAVAPLYPRR